MKSIHTNKVVIAVFALVFTLFGMGFDVTHANHDCENLTIEIGSGRAYGRVGENFEHQIDISGSELEDVDLSGLPRGLRFFENDLEIRGTPREEGTFAVEIVAENDCDRDTVDISVHIREAYSSGVGTTGESDPNVTLDSELVINKDGTYVYLSQIPYTGVGDVLQSSLALLALLLWIAALSYIMAGPEFRSRAKSVFYSFLALENTPSVQTVMDKSVLATEEESNYEEMPMFVTSYTDAKEEFDSEELQDLRTQANKDRALFSEKALQYIVTKASTTNENSSDVLNLVIDQAKGMYPREDGYLKVNESRVRAILG
ncbi:MAG: hypothetical protein U5L75_02155 [Candidatus Campbellbacteria bacterium]|nr:hypothetical protein [Candidatus Campbellbacteria bacterium]